jgi:hypothetical protein
MTVLAGCGDSGPQLSCSALIDAVRDKAEIVRKNEDALTDGMLSTSLEKGFDKAKFCPMAKRTVALADEIKRHSADYERRCPDRSSLVMAQGFSSEGTVSRDTVKSELCR